MDPPIELEDDKKGWFKNVKKNDFAEIKSLDTKAILGRVKKTQEEIAEVMMDKQMNKLKDLKTISKKKKDVAQMLTVLRQKELLEQLESEGKKEEKKGAVVA